MTPQSRPQGRLPLPAGTTPPPAPKRAVAPATAQQSGSSRWTSTRGVGGPLGPSQVAHARMGAHDTRAPRRGECTTTQDPITIDSHGQHNPSNGRRLPRTEVPRAAPGLCQPLPQEWRDRGAKVRGQLVSRGRRSAGAPESPPVVVVSPPSVDLAGPPGEGENTVFGAFSRGGLLPSFFTSPPPSPDPSPLS